MKASIFKIIPLLAFIPGLLLAAPIVNYESIVPVRHVYAPAGFNSNDNAEIVIEGYLPNLCYKSPSAKVVIKDNEVNISVKALQNLGGFSLCADVIVPFIQNVKIGHLNSGEYNLIVNGESPFVKNAFMKVYSQNGSVDEAIYANVSQIVNVENSRRVILKGQNPSDCFELDKINVIGNGINSYSIFPILKKVRDYCPLKPVQFSYEFNVPNGLDADQVLLHVRVMNGESINSLYNNKSNVEE